jgi:hypothetical protein
LANSARLNRGIGPDVGTGGPIRRNTTVTLNSELLSTSPIRSQRGGMVLSLPGTSTRFLEKIIAFL